MNKQPSGPRYEVRRANGTFHVFDTVYYGVVDARSSDKAAQARAEELNTRPRPARKPVRQ